jgi:hypothetical protein
MGARLLREMTIGGRAVRRGLSLLEGGCDLDLLVMLYLDPVKNTLPVDVRNLCSGTGLAVFCMGQPPTSIVCR